MAYPYSPETGNSERSLGTMARMRREHHKDNPDFLTQWALSVTIGAALAANRTIQAAYQGQPPVSQSELEHLKVAIDQAAVTAMEQSLHVQQSFRIRSVGSEGAKEVQYVGQAAPNLQGEYGPTSAPLRDIVTDAVEGTTAASKNRPGAISIMAMTESGGILPSQDDTFYMDKLFASAELSGVVSLAFRPEQNIQRACEKLRLHPEQLTVVVLNRPRNEVYITAAQACGVNLHLIEAGDLMPSLLAVSGRTGFDGRPVLLMGIGGYEEGVIAAAAAKALGAVAECRVWSKEAPSAHPILHLNDLVPGKAEKIVVSATAITDDPWFGLASTDLLSGFGEGSEAADSLIITQAGVQVQRSLQHPQLR